MFNVKNNLEVINQPTSWLVDTLTSLKQTPKQQDGGQPMVVEFEANSASPAEWSIDADTENVMVCRSVWEGKLLRV